jgi:hypothetical protein
MEAYDLVVRNDEAAFLRLHVAGLRTESIMSSDMSKLRTRTAISRNSRRIHGYDGDAGYSREVARNKWCFFSDAISATICQMDWKHKVIPVAKYFRAWHLPNCIRYAHIGLAHG